MGRDTLRWGVVATGGIATVVIGDLRRLSDVDLVAVSSRSLDRAQRFAAAHQIPRAYDSHLELLDDPDVDVVYVATPHAQHHAISKAALLAGKHVLCEKPLAMTVAQAEDLVTLARQRGLFLMEAMWTRFNPLIRLLRTLVQRGTIGEVRSVRADFGFAQPYDPAHRLWNPELGGGALHDLGIYPVSFAHLLLGQPQWLRAHGFLAPTGVDAEAALLLGYPDGVHAMLGCSLVSSPPAGATVIGTNGRIELPEPFYRPSMLTVLTSDDTEVHRIELDGAGYTYQLRAVTSAIRAGAVESEHMPHDETIAVLRTLTTALGQLGGLA
jgi:predicted dehydrogenase